MTFYCQIGQEMLNFVTNCCKLLKVDQAAERAVSSTGYALQSFRCRGNDYNQHGGTFLRHESIESDQPYRKLNSDLWFIQKLEQDLMMLQNNRRSNACVSWLNTQMWHGPFSRENVTVEP